MHVRAYVSYFAKWRSISPWFPLRGWPWRAAIVYAWTHTDYLSTIMHAHVRTVETILPSRCRLSPRINYVQRVTPVSRITINSSQRPEEGGGREGGRVCTARWEVRGGRRIAWDARPVLVNRADRYGKLSSRKLVRYTRSIGSLKRDISSFGPIDCFFLIDLFEFIIRAGFDYRG